MKERQFRFKVLSSNMKSEYDASQWELGKWRAKGFRFFHMPVEHCTKHAFHCCSRFLQTLSWSSNNGIAVVEVRGPSSENSDETGITAWDEKEAWRKMRVVGFVAPTVNEWRRILLLVLKHVLCNLNWKGDVLRNEWRRDVVRTLDPMIQNWVTCGPRQVEYKKRLNELHSRFMTMGVTGLREGIDFGDGVVSLFELVTRRLDGHFRAPNVLRTLSNSLVQAVENHSISELDACLTNDLIETELIRLMTSESGQAISGWKDLMLKARNV